MMIRGLIFDLNGTLIDIWTNEEDYQGYRVTANFLDYYGIRISPELLKKRYQDFNRRQRKKSPEKFPEFEAVKIFEEIIASVPPPAAAIPAHLAETAAVVFRAATRHKLTLYPEVEETLRHLKNTYVMAAVSDGQPRWALPELRSVGLESFFSFLLISGDFGFRKPDSRLFSSALEQLQMTAGEVAFVGNDMYRDIYGASQAGMKTVFFPSNQGDHRFHGAQPDYIIHRFGELPQAIAFLNARG